MEADRNDRCVVHKEETSNRDAGRVVLLMGIGGWSLVAVAIASYHLSSFSDYCKPTTVQRADIPSEEIFSSLVPVTPFFAIWLDDSETKPESGVFYSTSQNHVTLSCRLLLTFSDYS
ncbi:hypothetical protein Tcan_00241 [Toxocara canis]|uniref:Uncharacterized protein n=1 Tax=Toxocara canis TaxID=6265 RepID=A0A0B2VL30_TOXCA|nr:hypothetical protein Tcan_00241 [Toxocara canis]